MIKKMRILWNAVYDNLPIEREMEVILIENFPAIKSEIENLPCQYSWTFKNREMEKKKLFDSWLCIFKKENMGKKEETI